MECDVHLHALPNGEKNTQLYYALYDISLLFIELFLLEIYLLSLNWSIKKLINSLNEDLSQRGHHARERRTFFCLKTNALLVKKNKRTQTWN